MHTGKSKICKLTQASKNDYAHFYWATTQSSTQIELYQVYSLVHEECILIAPKVCVSLVFVYNTVDVYKVTVISSVKLLSYPYVQITTGHYCKRIAKLLQTEVMAVIVSTCSLLLVELLHKMIAYC